MAVEQDDSTLLHATARSININNPFESSQIQVESKSASRLIARQYRQSWPMHDEVMYTTRSLMRCELLLSLERQLSPAVC